MIEAGVMQNPAVGLLSGGACMAHAARRHSIGLLRSGYGRQWNRV